MEMLTAERHARAEAEQVHRRLESALRQNISTLTTRSGAVLEVAKTAIDGYRQLTDYSHRSVREALAAGLQHQLEVAQMPINGAEMTHDALKRP